MAGPSPAQTKLGGDFPSLGRHKISPDSRTACGERVGVRGRLLGYPSTRRCGEPLPLTRNPRCAWLPTSPRKRGEVIGRPCNEIVGHVRYTPMY
jgi:hypothetical protein